jgi:hypothetical protein
VKPHPPAPAGGNGQISPGGETAGGTAGGALSLTTPNLQARSGRRPEDE